MCWLLYNNQWFTQYCRSSYACCIYMCTYDLLFSFVYVLVYMLLSKEPLSNARSCWTISFEQCSLMWNKIITENKKLVTASKKLSKASNKWYASSSVARIEHSSHRALLDDMWIPYPFWLKYICRDLLHLLGARYILSVLHLAQWVSRAHPS